MDAGGLTVREQGWARPWYRVKTDSFELRLLPDPGEDLQAVNNVDAEVRTPDGNRWSATVLTVAELHRLMTEQWPETGEYSSGLCWHCPDGLIVREPGLDCIVRAVAAVVNEGLISDVLQLVGRWSADEADA